jgi:hypothetical protein
MRTRHDLTLTGNRAKCGRFPSLLCASPARTQAHDSIPIRLITTEADMKLDDVYGRDMDRLPHEQEAAWRDKVPPELEWDESEVTALVDEIICQHSAND